VRARGRCLRRRPCACASTAGSCAHPCLWRSPMKLLRLLQLASPVLPVGAYAYSQGLEHAVDARLVHDERSAGRWITDALTFGLARWELPAMVQMLQAWRRGTRADIAGLNSAFIASRE